MATSDKRIWLFGVFTACPLNDVVKDCTFRKYREMTSFQRWNYLESLSDEEVDNLIMLHKNCIKARISGKSKFCSAKLNEHSIGRKML